MQKTSLLRRLQVQTLHDATPPLSKIPPFTKIVVTFEPMKKFRCPERFKTYFLAGLNRSK